ncbi:TonB-dependent receptor plug domain-containing protein [Neptunitalea lumnitzerae]|nr:TonB-dependent receptor [Neptunitalea sp. Y10]
MKQNYLILFLFLIASFEVYSQDVPVVPLDEVEVSDTQLKRYSNTQQTRVLTDSVLTNNSASLTTVLNFTTPIYFKENGLGMVSSPSFRGTTAQQTAVLWNGININSQLNGQTDFNTVNSRTFDAIEVRSGGGSVLFGSGAIGGSVHLNNYIQFDKGLSASALLKYGSFNTLDATAKATLSKKDYSLQVGVSRLSSDNDFDFVQTDGSNSNGQFYNTTVNLNGGYKINDKNLLKYYSYWYDGERHFSVINPTDVKTKYGDYNTRNLLEWDGFYGKWISKLKLAYITEVYKYYANIDNDTHTNGKAKSMIGRYDLAYKVSPKLLLNSVIDITSTTGEGSSIPETNRTITAFNVMAKHQLTDKLLYEVTARKEFTDAYESPFLYSLGINYNLTKHYAISANGSKNFRIPTYNDLYWAGSGNPDLKPETSTQYEISNTYSSKYITLEATGFYSDIEDMIQWIPTGSLWAPVNIQRVKNYGVEGQMKASLKLNEHSRVVFQANYAYTVSKDRETDKQLVYVPYHKGGASLTYSFNQFSFVYQSLYVGEVFLLADNNPRYVLDGYSVANAGVDYTFGKQKTYTLGVKFNNIWNKAYQAMANRYMPGTNFNIYLHFKL